MSNACPSIYKIAEAAICLRRYDVGRVIYERYIEKCDNELPGAWHGLAICYEMTNQRERAREAYSKALQLHLRHNDPSNLLWGGWCALKLGNYQLAYELFKQSAEKDPGYAYTWHSLAVAAMRIGRRKEAEEAMAKYRALIREKPYDKRECEGLRMLMDALSKIGTNDELISDVKQLIMDMLMSALNSHGSGCGLLK